MNLTDLLFTPFTEYGFMRRGLVACLALSLSCAPVGVFLILRRLSLMGDAMSHAVLPGVALAFVCFGLSLWPMTIGGVAAGLLVAFLAGTISRLTPLKEETSIAAMALMSLAAGVLIVSQRGGAVDLMHVLFGNLLAVERESLLMIAGIASISLFVLMAIYRPLIMECFDPIFLKAQGGGGAGWHMAFIAITVLNLVAGFQALGTLMALGLMILPGAAASFWTGTVDRMIPLSIALAVLASLLGLLVSYHASLPSGPSIVLILGAIYLLSMLFGRDGSLYAQRQRHRHLKA